jgi:uncharacterized protein YqeY
MPLKDTIQSDMKNALRAGERERLGTIRMLLAAVKQREVDERIELSDAQVLATVEKQIKQRRDAAEMYASGGRPELEKKELAEIEVLRAYLPEPLSEAELNALIEAAIEATGADGIRDMGKVMAHLKSEAQGRVDMGVASKQVKTRLN